jgi:para-nitrobenzyl esterase
MGAFHSAEIPFVFDNLGGHARYPPQWPALPEDPGSLAVAGMMSDYWVAFATHGKPLVRGLPKWSPYTRTKRHFMRFKKGDVGPDVDLLPGMFELHQRIVNARRKEERVAWWFGEIGLFAPH